MATSRCAARALALPWLAALAWQARPAEGKLQAGTVRLGGPGGFGGVEDEDRWQYLSKFGFGLGAGRYDVRLRLREPVGSAADAAAPAKVQVNLDLFLDEDWARVETLPPCGRAAGGPTRKTHRVLDLSAVPGEWGPWHGAEVFHKMRPHIWYFAVSDCRSSAGAAAYEVEFEARMRQEGGSEFSVELRHMLAASALALVCLTAFLARLAVRCWRLWLDAGAVHPVIGVLASTVALQWAAQALHMSHLWAYRADGVGAGAADTLGEVLFMLSQVLSATLLIIIAQGYTLRCSKVGDLGCSVCWASAVVAVLHIALVALGRLLHSDASYKHHEHEGAVGWTLLAIRLALYAWFVAGVRSLRRRAGFRLQSFLRRFEVAGSMYFLAYPVIFVAVQAFAPYLQHPVMQVGLLAMQTASALWLADLFLSRGAYFEVSALGASLLPGGSTSGFGGFSTSTLKKEG